MRTVYREKRYYCGEYLDVYIFPVFETGKRGHGRGKKRKPTSAAQKKLNQRHREQMYWRDVITLEAVQHGTDEDGYSAETVTATEAFADVQSAKRSEFYKAKQIGIDIAITVKLRAADYDGQERLVWNGKRYKVERAYTEAREMYELNCSEYREAADNEHKQPDKDGA